MSRLRRRDFLRLTGTPLGLYAALGTERLLGAAPRTVKKAGAQAPWRPMLPKRPLGKTGFETTILGLGGFAALHLPDRDRALAIIEAALEVGVNYFDTAIKYGPSQGYLGEGLGKRRKDIWLTTKTLARTRKEALTDLETSLRTLRTDHVDLWLHHQVDTVEEVTQIFGPEGAAAAFQEAREQKLVRFIGMSGHRDPAVFAAALSAFTPDVILVPVNPGDRHHLSFLEGPVAEAKTREVGVVGMKVFAQGKLLSQLGYTSSEVMSYALSQPVSTVIIGCDGPEQVRENAAIASAFHPLSEVALHDLEERAKERAKDVTWFKRW
jgi:predicted aldo/keto reductase-like oxidoreductase